MKNKIILLPFLLMIIAGCKKPVAILFDDKSTASVVDRSAWVITASSQELEGEGDINGRVSALVDGNINTFWHSAWTVSPTPAYPHWISIDTKTENRLISVSFTARQNNVRGMTSFKLEGSKDGTTWINLKSTEGDFKFDPALKAPQSYPVKSDAIKYLKITMLTGPVATCHLAEIEAFKIKE